MQRRLQIKREFISFNDSADFEPVVLSNIRNAIKASRNVNAHVKKAADDDHDSLLDESTTDEIWGPPEIGRITEESIQEASDDSPAFEMNFSNQMFRERTAGKAVRKSIQPVICSPVKSNKFLAPVTNHVSRSASKTFHIATLGKGQSTKAPIGLVKPMSPPQQKHSRNVSTGSQAGYTQQPQHYVMTTPRRAPSYNQFVGSAQKPVYASTAAKQRLQPVDLKSQKTRKMSKNGSDFSHIRSKINTGISNKHRRTLSRVQPESYLKENAAPQTNNPVMVSGGGFAPNIQVNNFITIANIVSPKAEAAKKLSGHHSRRVSDFNVLSRSSSK